MNVRETARRFDMATAEVLGVLIDTNDSKLKELARANAELILHYLDKRIK